MFNSGFDSGLNLYILSSSTGSAAPLLNTNAQLIMLKFHVRWNLRCKQTVV